MRRATSLERLKRFLAEEQAATAVEYAVMLMLIVAVCIVAIQAVGSEASGLMEHCQEEMDEYMN